MSTTTTAARRGVVALLALVLLLPAGAALAEHGVFTAGDLWDTFLPTNVRKSYIEQADNPNSTWLLFRVGNNRRQFAVPTQTWPGGENIHHPWKQEITMVEYSPDPNFNNFTSSAEEIAKHYAYAFETSSVAGTRIDGGATEWVDPNKRHQQIYEGLTPTNLGINVRYRIRQYAVNHANMNDFIALELELTNTGVLDVNGDGVAEKTDNRINALVLGMRNEPINSMTNSTAGTEGRGGWFTGPTGGYDATPDADGNPWDVPVVFTGPAPSKLTEPHPIFGHDNGWAPDGSRSLGITVNHWHAYRDSYVGMQWLAAKQGALPASGSSVTQDDKKTIYDSHPVGEGAQRGWFTSCSKSFNSNTHLPWEEHTWNMGVFYANGGRVHEYADIDRMPDPNWFDVTNANIEDGNPLSFIDAVKPEADRGQPRGDMKYNNTFVQNWESGHTAAEIAANPALADWTNGFTMPYAFDGDHHVGIGPFSLEVGETINLVLVDLGGFRLQGIRKARKAAQWAYEQSWDVPEPPPTPDMDLEPTTDLHVNVKWDDGAEAAGDFAGYKIYRSQISPKVNSLELGTRLSDTYHTQTVEEPTPAQLAAVGVPNNPNISYDNYALQEPGSWGPWRLVKRIPESELANYSNPNASSDGYEYAFKDPTLYHALGYKYYYYVAAYDDESGEMAGIPYTSLETHKVNVNGRTGLWEGTFDYATASSFYPGGDDLAGLKAIGAALILRSPLADPQMIASGELDIRVTPNPYKRQALHDTGEEHKILFSNLPTGTEITILDLSGRIIDVLRFDRTNPQDGTLFWDMFSKDGAEVASGLYIYVADYPGGKQVGHFGIMH